MLANTTQEMTSRGKQQARQEPSPRGSQLSVKDVGQPSVRQPRRDLLTDLLHAAAVGLAFLAVIEAVVTIATSEPTRPRILAFVLAGLSVLAASLGFRRFRFMGRVDAGVALAADAWVLIDGGW